ncbi:MAG TPA: TetR/AcrR family transcriptional regulator [Candidatus Acidoferrales bacterium]|nr:TetR/AcrR family transcriptional regulator [Candidatus Acidoferrales bacterium]
MPKVSQAHLDARRGQILEGAVACFARQGFHRTTMQDIVSECGLSPGAIYNYFEGKEQIIEAIADARHGKEEAFIAAAKEQATVGDALRQIRDGFFRDLDDPHERRRRRVSIQLWAEAQRNPRIKKLVRRGIDQPRELLAALIRDGQQRKEVAADLDPEATARLMIAVFHGFVLQLDWDGHAQVEPYVEVLDALLKRLLS